MAWRGVAWHGMAQSMAFISVDSVFTPYKSLPTLSTIGPLSPGRQRQQHGQSNSLKSILWDNVESLKLEGRGGNTIASFLCSQLKPQNHMCLEDPEQVAVMTCPL